MMACISDSSKRNCSDINKGNNQVKLGDVMREGKKWKFWDPFELDKHTNLLASEHKSTTCLFGALKILKNTGVNSSNFCEAKVRIPNGPTPP